MAAMLLPVTILGSDRDHGVGAVQPPRVPARGYQMPSSASGRPVAGSLMTSFESLHCCALSA